MKHNGTPAMFDTDQDPLFDVDCNQCPDPTPLIRQYPPRDQSELVTLVNEIARAGYPTTGQLAVRLWELLSNHRSPFGNEEAAEIYRNLGYIPFNGYPLARARK
jgi:hypothetical protein